MKIQKNFILVFFLKKITSVTFFVSRFLSLFKDSEKSTEQIRNKLITDLQMGYQAWIYRNSSVGIPKLIKLILIFT